MRRAITIIVITIAFLNIASSKAYCTNLIALALPELVLENDTLDNPEQAPQFPGGTKELMKYLNVRLKFEGPPYQGMDQVGRVIVQFIIDREGNVIKPRIKKSLDPFLDKEALRIISLLPRFQPGIDDGKPVMTRYTVPVAFRFY